MLHLVPALILLILQGPTGADRLPCIGGLPGALEALNARSTGADFGAARGLAHDANLASLLALGAHDPHWTAMIAGLLGADWEAATPINGVGFESAGEPESLGPIPSIDAGVPRLVATTNCRFRDGPSTR
jgi:hypothetical protein